MHQNNFFYFLFLILIHQNHKKTYEKHQFDVILGEKQKLLQFQTDTNSDFSAV
jgi:restriction endonuclease